MIPPEGLFEPKLHSRAMQKHVIRRPFAWPLLVSCYRNRAAVQVLAVATNAAIADWRDGDHFSGSTASDEGQSISSRIIVGCSGHQSAAASVAKNSSASRANASCKSRVRAAGPRPLPCRTALTHSTPIKRVPAGPHHDVLAVETDEDEDASVRMRRRIRKGVKREASHAISDPGSPEVDTAPGATQRPTSHRASGACRQAARSAQWCTFCGPLHCHPVGKKSFRCRVYGLQSMPRSLRLRLRPELEESMPAQSPPVDAWPSQGLFACFRTDVMPWLCRV